jgi:hypothetical protein
MYYEFTVDPPSSGEQVVGFQIPYYCDFLKFSIGNQTETIEVSKVETVWRTEIQKIQRPRRLIQP